MPKKITLKPSIGGADETMHFDAPELAESSAGSMLSLRDDGMSEAFPVLKAFQDFLETERQQARKRMMTMTIIFCAAMVLVIAGFLLAFSVLFKQLTAAQNRLLDTLSEKHAAASAPAVSEEQTARQIALAAKQMETNLNASLSAIVGAATEKMNGKVAAQNQELAQMRETLLVLQKENQKLHSDMAVAKPALPPAMEPAHKPVPVVAAPMVNSVVSTPSNTTILASTNPAVSKSAISANISAVASAHTAPATTGNVTSVSARLPAVATPALGTSKDAPSNTTSAAAIKSDWKGYDGAVFTFTSRNGMDTITWHAFTPTSEQ